jgi:predicted nuclease of restriction endonuclease-like RecB superfamily
VVTISRNYNPDFVIPCNDGNVYVECKGKFDYRSRETMTNLTDIERNSLVLAVSDYTKSYQGVSRDFTIKHWGKRYGISVIDKQDNSMLISKIKAFGGLKV